MKSFFNFNYIIDKNTKEKIGVVCTYELEDGKTVRGISKCHPHDEFNEDIGRELALLRCQTVVNNKRIKLASRGIENLTKEMKKNIEKTEELLTWKENLEAAQDRVNEAMKELYKNLENAY